MMLMLAFSRDVFCDALTASVVISIVSFGFILFFHAYQEMKKRDFYRIIVTKISQSKEMKFTVKDFQESSTKTNEQPSISYVELRENLLET